MTDREYLGKQLEDAIRDLLNGLVQDGYSREEAKQFVLSKLRSDEAQRRRSTFKAVDDE